MGRAMEFRNMVECLTFVCFLIRKDFLHLDQYMFYIYLENNSLFVSKWRQTSEILGFLKGVSPIKAQIGCGQALS